MVNLDGKLYVVGGVGISIEGPRGVLVYDPAAQRWDASPAPLPTAREHLAAVPFDGKLYVLGGRWGSNLSTVEVYDPQTDTWTRLPDLPTARSGFTAAVLDGQIHVTGGEDFNLGRTLGQHEVLDPVSQTWTRLPDLPTPRHGLVSGAVGGRWIVIGGGPVPDVSASQQVDIFTPQE
jgi:N-acetylneuraminic acid mutarotase